MRPEGGSVFEAELRAIESEMRCGLHGWPTAIPNEAREMVERQIGRRGQKLRPVFALIVADLLGVARDRVIAHAAAVELYHCASLVLDDVQDNSAFRRGDASVHVAASVSNAINLAGVVRSFSYYPIHGATGLSVSEKLSLHLEVDAMSTAVPLGQSMEIGWHQGWFGEDVTRFPYHEMTRLKTGAPFACAAAGVAVIAGVEESLRDSLRELGFTVGVLYQLVDDYSDLRSITDRVSDDVRDGKPTRAIQILAERADAVTAGRVLRELRDPAADRSWMARALRDSTVTSCLEGEIERLAGDVLTGFEGLSLSGSGLDEMSAFVGAWVESARP